MNLFIDSHQQFIQRLLDSGVEFIVVGGYAVIYHGYKRTTGDIGIWLKPTNENRERLIEVLATLDFSDESLNQLSQLDFRETLVFSINEEPEKIDFLTKIANVTYDEDDSSKIITSVDGMQIPFLRLNHLVLSKFNTGRTKDAADIEELQKIQNKSTK